MLSALIRFWPIFVPLIIFLVWYIRASQHKDIKVIDQFHERRRRYLMYALSATAIIAIICSLIYVLTRQDNTHKEYIPAYIDNGQLIPATFKDKPKE